MVSQAQQFGVLDIRRAFGWQRRLRVGLGEAVEAEHLRVNFPPEIGVVAFPAAQVLDNQRFGSDVRRQEVKDSQLRFVPVTSCARWLQFPTSMVGRKMPGKKCNSPIFYLPTFCQRFGSGGQLRSSG